MSSNIIVKFPIYKEINTDYIVHSDGYLLNLKTLYIIYETKDKLTRFNKQTINMKTFMISKFYNIHILKNNIIHNDHNLLNNNIHNLTIINKNKNNLINNISYKKTPIHFIVLLHQYDINNNLLKCYTNYKQNYLFDGIDKKKFTLLLLSNKIILFKNFKWKLTIKRIELNNIYKKYMCIIEPYYLSNDFTHVINIKTLQPLYIYNNYKTPHYVKLTLSTSNIFNFTLFYYNNPHYYIKIFLSNYYYNKITSDENMKRLDNDLYDKNYYKIINEFKNFNYFINFL